MRAELPRKGTGLGLIARTRAKSVSGNGVKAIRNKPETASDRDQRIQLVPIAKIDIGSRHRKQYGDLKPLANSIKELGLLQPIGITEKFKLVFGGRRLRACRNILKQSHILARIVNVSSIVAGEHDENELRKDFTPSEKVAIAKALQQEIGERRGNPSIRHPGDELDGRTDELVAKRAGFCSRRTMRDAQKVVEKGISRLIDAMDDGKVPITIASRIADVPAAEQEKLLEFDSRSIRKAVRKPHSNGQFPAASETQSEKVSGTDDWVTAIVTDLKNHWKTVETILAPICDEERDVKLKLIEKRVLVSKLREIKELHRDLERALPAERLPNR